MKTFKEPIRVISDCPYCHAKQLVELSKPNEVVQKICTRCNRWFEVRAVLSGNGIIVDNPPRADEGKNE